MKLSMKIIDQTRNEFKQYLQPYMAVMDKPRQKVLPELIEGILSSGSCLIAESARQIDPEHLETTERRFLRTLESPHWDETNLWIGSSQANRSLHSREYFGDNRYYGSCQAACSKDGSFGNGTRRL